MSADGHGSTADTLSAASLRLPAGHPWSRLPAIGSGMAIVGLGAALLLGLASPAVRPQLWHSWLVAALFSLSVALGALFFVLVHHATQAGWGVVVRRFAECAADTLPYMGLLFLPLVAGLGDLFHWTHADAVAADPLLAQKRAYLNVPFFLVRALVYFGVWSALSIRFGRLSRRQDASGDPEITRRLRRESAPALILYALTVTFASFDWLMSLDPHWYSTIFGVYFFSGCAVGGFAFLVLVSIGARRSGLLGGVVHTEHLHDLGKLLFAFVAFWAYIAFSQFLLIWYGAIPEETTFFAHRLAGSWRGASLFLAAGHFIVPFFFLLPRTVKRHERALAAAAAWMLLVHLVDLHWLVAPNLHPEGFAPGWLDLATLIGSVGMFLTVFGRSLRSHALVPLRDPRLPESLLFENP